jgi:hypothetical protein
MKEAALDHASCWLRCIFRRSARAGSGEDVHLVLLRGMWWPQGLRARTHGPLVQRRTDSVVYRTHVNGVPESRQGQTYSIKQAVW